MNSKIIFILVAMIGGFTFYFFLTALFIGVVIDATYTQGYSYGGPTINDILLVAFGNSFWICFISGIAGGLKTWWAIKIK